MLDFVSQLASRVELNDGVCEFILRLLDLARKLKSSLTRADARYFAVVVEFVRSKAGESQNKSEFLNAVRQLQQS